MLRNRTQHSAIYTSAILTAVAACLTLFPISIVRANAAQGSAATMATYRTKCALCHGQDGSGSDLGKSMNVPDLRSETVQKLPDTELAQAISNGKGGMPSFKNSLSEDQIHSLVSYVRSLHQKK